tara:strand:- start:420 stop:1172 length:753 start_codon:yes stop_codon:yes gene_type:complete
VQLSNKIKKFLSNNNFDFVHLESVHSTMLSSKKYIGDKNICILADEQITGIGRRGNKWISPKGNIYISFLIKCDLSIEKHFLFSALTANSITKFLNNSVAQNIEIKWPNDININGEKIAGIMTEIFMENNKQYIIIGAGINILNCPKIKDYKTCCLKDYNPNLNYVDVLENFFECYFTEYEMLINKNYDQIFNYFKSKMSHLGSKINILLPDGETKRVLIKNLNLNGSLLIEEAGKQKNIFSGRIINDIN